MKDDSKDYLKVFDDIAERLVHAVMNGDLDCSLEKAMMEIQARTHTILMKRYGLCVRDIAEMNRVSYRTQINHNRKLRDNSTATWDDTLEQRKVLGIVLDTAYEAGDAGVSMRKIKIATQHLFPDNEDVDKHESVTEFCALMLWKRGFLYHNKHKVKDECVYKINPDTLLPKN